VLAGRGWVSSTCEAGTAAAVSHTENTDRRLRTTSLNLRIITETIQRRPARSDPLNPEHISVFVNNRVPVRKYKQFQMYGQNERAIAVENSAASYSKPCVCAVSLRTPLNDNLPNMYSVRGINSERRTGAAR